MKLRFIFLLSLVALMARGAVPSYNGTTLVVSPTNLHRSNFLDSATLTWSKDQFGRMTPNVIGGASSNAQPPNITLTNLSGLSSTNQLVFTNSMSEANTVFLRKDGDDATGQRGRRDRPFLNLSNAFSALQPYDLLLVGAGHFYGNTTVTSPPGCKIIGQGRNNSIIQNESTIVLSSTNYLQGFKFFTTNTGVGGVGPEISIIPLVGVNTTNLVVNDIHIDAYYDGFILQGDGNNSMVMYNSVIDSSYDAINAAAWGQNTSLEMYGCRLRVNYTKGPVSPEQSRAFYGVTTKVRAVGCVFESLNWTNGRAFDLQTHAELVGCILYSPTGHPTTPPVELLDLDPESPTFFQVTGIVHVAQQFYGTKVDGLRQTPATGVWANTNVAAIGQWNWITNAPPNVVVVGVSNFVGVAGSNTVTVGKNLTNNTPNTLDLGMDDTTKTTIDPTNTTVRGTWKYTGATPTDGHVLTTDGNGLARWAGATAIGPYIPYTNGHGTNTSFWEGLTVDTDGMTNNGNYIGGGSVAIAGSFSGNTIATFNGTFTNRVISGVKTLAYAGTTNVTVNMALGNHFTLTLTNNAKLWFTNMVGAGWSQTALIDFVMGGSGSYLLYWDTTNVRTNPANPIVLSTAAGSIDDMHVKTDSTGTNVHILLNTGWLK